MSVFALSVNSVSRLLFENAILLLILLVAVQFVMIALWSRWRTRAWTRVVWIGFILVVALPVLSVVVVTSRERVIGLCRDLAKMVDRGDVAGIGPHLANDFVAGGLGKDDFLIRVEQQLSQYRVDDPSLRRFETTFPGRGQAEVVFDASCTVRSVDNFVSRLPSRWRVRMIARDRRWLLTQVEALPTPLSPIRDLRDCLP
jgi:hypothetical protein